MKPLCWAYTVRLTLSIQCSNDLLFLFEDGALPMIEYLHVINEEPRCIDDSFCEKSKPNKQFDFCNFRQATGCVRLRWIILCNFSLYDLTNMLALLKTPLLEEMILVDSHANCKLFSIFKFIFLNN